MNPKAVSLYLAVAFLMFFSVSSNAYYEVIDLGTLGGNFSVASSINDNGQIVGKALILPATHACLFDPARYRNSRSNSSPCRRRLNDKAISI